MRRAAQLSLFDGTPDTRAAVNKIRREDRSVHDWYRFVLSFPPHLVRDYLDKFGVGTASTVLDPFCGTGTTLVECKKAGIRAQGVEANPVAAFASAVKVDWDFRPVALVEHACQVVERARLELERLSGTLRTLPVDKSKLLLRDSISPVPLHKALVLLDAIEATPCRFTPYERLAFARAVVENCSNLKFGPEVGLGPRRADAPVLESWLQAVESMAADWAGLPKEVKAEVFHGDARDVSKYLKPRSITAVITSPPYPNEKDYSRATRLESVLLGFVNSKEQLKDLKRGLLRSNTRGVYKSDDDDEQIQLIPEVRALAEQIEERRHELGKTSGFEKLYGRVTRLYFGGMAKHLLTLQPVLERGARLAYVVGDQASYFRIKIPTGQLLATIAERQGYEVSSIDLFRTRKSTATGDDLREEVVVLRWPGAGYAK